MLMEGKTPWEAVKALGIDPEILGEHRVAGLKAIVRKKVKAGEGFRDYSTYTGGQSAQPSKDAKIRFLEQQLAYKDQEIDFLKKLCLWAARGMWLLEDSAQCQICDHTGDDTTGKQSAEHQMAV